MKCTFKSLRYEMTHRHVNAIRNQNIILVRNSRQCEFSDVNTPYSKLFFIEILHYFRRLLKRWVFSPYKSLCFECYVACVQNPPPPSPLRFYWGDGGVCTQAKCYATCRCSYFELGQPVVQRPVFDSRPRIFFPFLVVLFVSLFLCFILPYVFCGYGLVSMFSYCWHVLQLRGVLR